MIETDPSLFQDMPKGADDASTLDATALRFHSGTSTSLTSSAVVTFGLQESLQSSPNRLFLEYNLRIKFSTLDSHRSIAFKSH